MENKESVPIICAIIGGIIGFICGLPFAVIGGIPGAVFGWFIGKGLGKEIGGVATGEECCLAEGCYVATAAYGNGSCEQLQILRNFRDNYLKKRILGKIFICFYYSVGPYLAVLVKWSPLLKSLATKFIDYLIKEIRKRNLFRS